VVPSFNLNPALARPTYLGDSVKTTQVGGELEGKG
jgi:hypothetical protein